MSGRSERDQPASGERRGKAEPHDNEDRDEDQAADDGPIAQASEGGAIVQSERTEAPGHRWG